MLETISRVPLPEPLVQPVEPGHQTIMVVEDHEEVRQIFVSVLERADGLNPARNGRVAATTGVTAASVAESDSTSRVRVNSDNGGQVVFARLGWPGYQATLNGHELPTRLVAKTFVAVDIPPGTKNGDLELTWRPPGWMIGAAAILLGLVGAGFLQWAYLRRRDADGPVPADDEPATPEPDLASTSPRT